MSLISVGLALIFVGVGLYVWLKKICIYKVINIFLDIVTCTSISLYFSIYFLDMFKNMTQNKGFVASYGQIITLVLNLLPILLLYMVAKMIVTKLKKYKELGEKNE